MSNHEVGDVVNETGPKLKEDFITFLNTNAARVMAMPTSLMSLDKAEREDLETELRTIGNELNQIGDRALKAKKFKLFSAINAFFSHIGFAVAALRGIDNHGDCGVTLEDSVVRLQVVYRMIQDFTDPNCFS